MMVYAAVATASFWSVLGFFALIYCGFIGLALANIVIDFLIKKIKAAL
jgi:hypothetical protein